MHNKSAFLLAITLVVTLFFGAPLAHAKEVKYKDLNLDLREGDKLSLVAMKGSVKLNGTSKALTRTTGDSVMAADGAGNASVRVRKAGGVGAAAEAFDAWTFSVRRDGNQVRIEAKGPEAKSDWENQLKKDQFPELIFEIDAPGTVASEIALRQGNVVVQNWRSSLSIQVVEGAVRLTKNEGALKIQNQRGEIKIDGHKGRVELDGFNPKIALAQIEGEVALDNFSGESNVQGLKGRLNVRSFSGQSVIAKSEGGVDFELGRGSLNYQGSGAVRGQLDNGTVLARVAGDPEVNVESQEGSVSIDIESNASPTVRLQTEDGSLNAPGDLPSTRIGNGRVINGRLNGGGQGSVFVKTKTGNVRLF